MTLLPPRIRRALRCLALVLPLAAGAASLDDLRQLVDSGQYDKAWQLAAANPQLIGDVHFDFLYGVAAVNSGHVAEGILALERHLAAVPGNDRARLELARGYYLVDEFARARAEFEFVLRYNPPAAVRENINRFLQAMALRDAGQRRNTAARLYAEAGAGHDSNVNGGTYRDEVQLAFDTLKPIGNSKEIPDNFVEVAVGGQQEMRVSNQLSVFAGVDLDQKSNLNAKDFDLTNMTANVGFARIAGPGLYRGTISVNGFQVGGARYRDTLAGLAEASYSLGPQTGLSLAAGYSEMRYAGAENVRNERMTQFAGVLTQNFPAFAGSPQLGLRVSLAQEDNEQMRPDLGRKTVLARLFGSFSPAERLRVTAGLTGYTQKYGAEDIVFGSVRRDTIWNIDLVAVYALAPNWTLRAEYVNLVTKSNQDLYDSRHQTIALKTRYQY